MRPAPILLAGLGLLQIAAELAGAEGLKFAAWATAASPAPKVFSAVNGYETFSTRFWIEGRDASGRVRRVRIDRSRRMNGPYNRRNVYGAVLAYGPVLPSHFFRPTSKRALCGSSVSEWLGGPLHGPRILYETRHGERLHIEVRCQ